MTPNPPLTDRVALRRFRDRAPVTENPAFFLHDRAVIEIQERLQLVNKVFTSPVIVTGFADYWQARFPDAVVIADTDDLDLSENAHDLVVHAMSLHWTNDPVGQLIQANRALMPDGLFLAIFPAGQTLIELRQVFAQAETKITGGISPRIAPMGDIRDLGHLLQRAGFALPVAEIEPLNVTYDSALGLMRDLRLMGESNAMAARSRTPLRRSIIENVTSAYDMQFAHHGRIPATFELASLTGWAPSENQPKPLKPGTATAPLSSIL